MNVQTANTAAIDVLIVEDDRASRTALTRLVKRLRYAPLAVANLAAAREVLARMTPEMLILDLNLPDGDGTSLLAEIRHSRRRITVAVVTAVTDQLKLHEVTNLKPDALFGKPIDLDDFEDWLIGQRTSSAISITSALVHAGAD